MTYSWVNSALLPDLAIDGNANLGVTVALTSPEACQVGSPYPVLIVRRVDQAVGAQPIDGESYNVGDDLGGEQKVVAKGFIDSFQDTTVSTGHSYSYAVWVYNPQSHTYAGPAQIAKSLNNSGQHRYWRLLVKSSTGTLSRVTELQLHFNGAWQSNAKTSNTAGTIGGYNATLAQSSAYSAAHQAYIAFNGTKSDNYGWTTAANTYSGANLDGTQWVSIDFGTSFAPAIDGIRLLNGFDLSSYSPDLFEFQYSDDGITWTRASDLYVGDIYPEVTLYW